MIVEAVMFNLFRKDKKYKLVKHDGSKAPKELWQLKALRDIPEYGVRAGDLGGFVESEDNLSHKGSCWVIDSARVCGGARVIDSAIVTGRAWVSGKEQVWGEAQVGGEASIKGTQNISKVGDYVNISGFLGHSITIFRDRNISIGCEYMSYEEWEKFDWKSRVSEEEMKKYREVIKANLKFFKK